MSIADDNGVTKRDHFIQGGAMEALEPPVPFPELLAHVWSAFIELDNARPPGGMGPGPLTYEGIKAWMDVTGQRLASWEVAAVKRLDNLWLRVQAEARRER